MISDIMYASVFQTIISRNHSNGTWFDATLVYRINECNQRSYKVHSKWVYNSAYCINTKILGSETLLCPNHL